MRAEVVVRDEVAVRDEVDRHENCTATFKVIVRAQITLLGMVRYAYVCMYIGYDVASYVYRQLYIAG